MRIAIPKYKTPLAYLIASTKANKSLVSCKMSLEKPTWCRHTVDMTSMIVYNTLHELAR
jgi:hypothetical protein